MKKVCWLVALLGAGCAGESPAEADTNRWVVQEVDRADRASRSSQGGDPSRVAPAPVVEAVVEPAPESEAAVDEEGEQATGALPRGAPPETDDVQVSGPRSKPTLDPGWLTPEPHLPWAPIDVPSASTTTRARHPGPVG